LQNLVQIKKLRESIGDRFRLYSAAPKGLDLEGIKTKDFPFNPEKYPYDQISTFLICEQFDFQVTEENIHEEINSLYGETLHDRYKVDFILSLKDGFVGYYKEGKEFLFYPSTKDGYKIELVKSNDKKDHVKQFVNLFYNRLTLTSIVKPEISEYFK